MNINDTVFCYYCGHEVFTEEEKEDGICDYCACKLDAEEKIQKIEYKWRGEKD